jgi:hypothetical protein
VYEAKIITLHMLQQSGQPPHKNNVDKAQGVYKGRKLPLGATEVLQLSYEEEPGPTIIASRSRYQRVSACHMLGNQAAGATSGNSGTVLAIAEPVGGNYAFGEFVTATELGAS